MQVTHQLQKRLDQAVRVSMRIEGYRPSASLQVQARAKELMEQQRAKYQFHLSDIYQPGTDPDKLSGQ